MRKTPGTKTSDSGPAISDLREACFKLRGLAYLIEQCGDDPCPPSDLPDAFYGVGLLLTQLHGEIIAVARSLDRQEATERTP
jgi:hypothetical protein